MAGRRLTTHLDETGVDRSYYHGTISREEAVVRLEKAKVEGTFLLRMSSTQDKQYTISVIVGGEIKHIRVNNEESDKYSLGKSKEAFDSIWDLIEAQLDRHLKSTKGDSSVALIHPLESKDHAVAPDLLQGAKEAGMDASAFNPDVMAFITGGKSSEEIVRERLAKKNAAK